MTENKTRNYAEGETIFEKGDTKAELYLILSGQVQLSNPDSDTKKKLPTISKGQILGGISFVLAQPKTSKAIADTDVSCMVIDETMREQMMNKVPNWFRLLVEDLISNIKHTYEKLDTIRTEYNDMEREYSNMKNHIKTLKEEIPNSQVKLAQLTQQLNSYLGVAK